MMAERGLVAFAENQGRSLCQDGALQLELLVRAPQTHQLFALSRARRHPVAAPAKP